MTAAPGHAQRAHALLSASAAHRWLNCTPSAVLESHEEDKGSPYAAEGTLAHEIAEIYLRSHLNHSAADAGALKGDKLYSPEMEEHAAEYGDYVASQITAEDAQVDVEAKLDFSKYVPGGFGTGDCVIVQDGALTVVDYKYGQGVKVEAERNPQMMLYALGAIELYDFAYSIDRVRLCIFQPRLGHISEWEIARAELETWAEKVLTPQAKLAAKGEGKFEPGGHCQFCKFKTKCRPLAAYCLSTADKDFEDESGELSTYTLDPWDWNRILDRADIVEKWVKAVKEEALHKLLDDPGAIPGYKIVEGRSNRAYKDSEAVITALRAGGCTAAEIFKPQELLGITDMTKSLGKKRFGELLAGLIVKPQGKPALAPVTDKRPQFVPTNPVADFENEEEKEIA